ncbi:MAG: hypothetical protein M9953_01280 [Thermomicrobiales bacterium]|nr:hypothetical protein [Thermomicrobiales bacterium]MCO5217462.1 hypothetical protein [Thermomicrobiales bacterium]MCO5223944.1 hypothetical protein [Thermomicrobiales bacterium]MCO5226758.1 hypothetical protein [Thermomicrobiales bacterium]
MSVRAWIASHNAQHYQRVDPAKNGNEVDEDPPTAGVEVMRVEIAL